MTDVTPQAEDWQTLPWKQFQRNVYRLQKRIYQAERRDDYSRAICNGCCLGRDRRGSRRASGLAGQPRKRTAGVDGVASLTPSNG